MGHHACLFCLFPTHGLKPAPIRGSPRGIMSAPAFPDLSTNMVHSLLLGVTLVSPTNAQHSGQPPPSTSCFHVFCIPHRARHCTKTRGGPNRHSIQFLQSPFGVSVEEAELWVPPQYQLPLWALSQQGTALAQSPASPPSGDTERKGGSQ